MNSKTYPECNHRHGIVLKPEKIDEYLTNLVCEKCGEIVASWESKPEDIRYVSPQKLQEWA